MLASLSLKQAEASLLAAGVVSAAAEAELLMCHLLEISRGELVTQLVLDRELQSPDGYFDLVGVRCTRVPLQHITGKAPFRSIELKVGKGVFIPRPETEQVVQVAIDFLALLPGQPKALDIGTGSGAIAISIAKETHARVTAIELSSAAAEFARANIEALNVDVELLEGDFMEHIGNLPQFDLIISNPPYIPASMVPVDLEVRDYDPALALYGGEDGLDVVRDLAASTKLILREGGLLVLEHADGQSDSICELLLENNWRSVQVHPDPTGRLRAVSATR
jgi:release factor glutamine methyltransferase